MAYQLAAWIQCNDRQQADLIRQFLDRDTRPHFVEDVPAHQQALFERLDRVEFPAESAIQQDCLWLFWYKVDNFGFSELTALLSQLGLKALFIFEVPDYPMSGDTDEDEVSGRFWMMGSKGEYNRVSRATVADKFPAGIIERLPQ